mmetsp:Transcript_12260/g.37790  ORF Transcript_12260/g.37790 Transcript_12260/m.37790 type:complete len:309 (+) Transcript_12260:353-1279(+)
MTRGARRVLAAQHELRVGAHRLVLLGLDHARRNNQLGARADLEPVLHLDALRHAACNLGHRHARGRLIARAVLPARFGARRVRHILPHRLHIHPRRGHHARRVLHRGLGLELHLRLVLVLSNLPRDVGGRRRPQPALSGQHLVGDVLEHERLLHREAVNARLVVPAVAFHDGAHGPRVGALHEAVAVSGLLAVKAWRQRGVRRRHLHLRPHGARNLLRLLFLLGVQLLLSVLLFGVVVRKFSRRAAGDERAQQKGKRRGLLLARWRGALLLPWPRARRAALLALLALVALANDLVRLGEHLGREAEQH